MAVPSRRVVDVSAATFLRLLAVVAGVWIWLHIWEWVLLFIVAVFLAIALDPMVRWLDGRGFRRAVAAPLVALLLAAVVLGFVYQASAALAAQTQLLSDRIEAVQLEAARRIPPRLLILLPRAGDAGQQIGGYVGLLGAAILTALIATGIALILTVYLLLDGRRTYEWLVAFVPRDHRYRLQKTVQEARRAVAAYIRGNIASASFAMVFVFVSLELLNVPAALLLALLAGMLDFIPVLGFLASATPAVLLALTVSPWTAVAVAGLYVFYHAVENYYIIPKVYGRELRLSNLAIIAAFAVGVELGGVLGAMIALPLASMYPVIEDMWLADRLGHDAVRDHRRIERSEKH
jgi:predicted PurR-regulated permease PerM